MGRWTLMMMIALMLAGALWGCGDDGAHPAQTAPAATNNGTSVIPEGAVCLTEEEAGEYHPVCWPQVECLEFGIVPCATTADCSAYPGTACPPWEDAWCGIPCTKGFECASGFCSSTETVSHGWCQTIDNAKDPLCNLRASVGLADEPDACNDDIYPVDGKCLRLSEPVPGAPGFGPHGPRFLVDVP